MLFIRGKAISGAPNIRGTNQFPKPPIKIGITIKKLLQKHVQLQLHYKFGHHQLKNQHALTLLELKFSEKFLLFLIKLQK